MNVLTDLQYHSHVSIITGSICCNPLNNIMAYGKPFKGLDPELSSLWPAGMSIKARPSLYQISYPHRHWALLIIQIWPVQSPYEWITMCNEVHIRGCFIWLSLLTFPNLQHSNWHLNAFSIEHCQPSQDLQWSLQSLSKRGQLCWQEELMPCLIPRGSVSNPAKNPHLFSVMLMSYCSCLSF